jgi:serine/threonine protein kinase
MEEISKNKIIKNKDKMNNNKIYENKNNSVNQGTIYKNIKQMNNNNKNTNITDNININISNYSHILPNKNKYMNQNITGFDLNNLMPGPTAADGPNSYRVPQKRSNSILDDEEYFIYYNKSKKNANQKNIIDKKLFSTNKIIQKTKNDPSFKTIIAKKNLYNQKQNITNNKESNNDMINNVKKNNFLQQNISKTNSIFSSTMTSLSKPKPQKQQSKNYNLEVKSKTSYPTKNNSRKQSNEKSVHKGNNTNNNSKNKYKNYSNINHMRVYSDKNKYINKNKTPIITKNNKKLDSNNNYKVNSNNNSNNSNKKYINNSNIVQIIPNGLNNSQYKLSNINSTNNSKEYSRENSSKQNKINANIIDLKKTNVDKILNQLHKNKDKNNISKEDNELKEKINKIINKNIYSDINNINYRDFKKISKINVNKNSNPIIVKEEKISENNSNTNSKKELLKQYNKNNKKESEDYMKSGKKDLLFAYNLNKKDKEDKKENKENKESKENKENKDVNALINVPDKDLSDNENDSLLLYINNNIENNIHDSMLNESSSSIISTLKENGKFSCYNRDMEIISNYIKNYNLKYNKYPTTKMNFYKYGRLLGKGAFGKVNLSLHVLTGRLVAIKSINKAKLINERQKRKIQIETTIMKTLSKSNNIVKIFETYETKKHYCIVMEYICAGDLLSYIKKRGKLTEQVAKFIFKQIILTLQYIHNHNIVHRDIKLDNILIDLDNNIKICDFGVSKIIRNNESMIEQCGTPAYIAPEILLNRGYEGFGVDIWSAGVVLYAMLSGTVPFKGNNIRDLHDLIIKGEYVPIKEISKEATHLIRCILEVDPKKRISSKDILVHPWLIDVDLNYWKNQNLFTNAEYILLAKSNVDYRDIGNKEDMIEIFDIKNIDTNDENQNKNVKTKSFILAPFNSSIEEEYDNYMSNKESLDCNNSDLKIQNGLIKFNNRVKDLNRHYELDNNQEIDNGVIISPNGSDEKNKKENNDISPYNGSYNSKGQSKPFSPRTEIEEAANTNRNKVNFNNKEDEINDKALDDLKVLGYKKSFVKESLINNCFNYATTSYRLIVKYCYS